jgi:hypothetical protein
MQVAIIATIENADILKLTDNPPDMLQNALRLQIL